MICNIVYCRVVYIDRLRIHSGACGDKPAFHDADTDTDTETDILATILARMSGVGVVECQLYCVRDYCENTIVRRQLRR